MGKPTPEEVIAPMAGDRERFREIVTDKDGLLERMCDYAEAMALREGCEPWSIVGHVTGHGSGISNAIYQLYRKRK